MNRDSIRHSEREVVLHETKESGSALELHPLHNAGSIIWLKEANMVTEVLHLSKVILGMERNWKREGRSVYVL
jgi:hypothetical protein